MEYLKDHKEIRFIRMVYPDILGHMRDQMIPVDRVESFLDDGAGIDGSSVTGLREGVNESDLLFMPESESFLPLPWVYRAKTEAFVHDGAHVEYPLWREALFFGKLLTPDGKPFEGDTRHVLDRYIEESMSNLFTDFMVGPELEFFLFPNDREPIPTDKGEYHAGGKFGEVRKEVQLLFENMGWECDHHEVANGQHEIDLRYDTAKRMADKIMVVKYAIKSIAEAHGLHASFMPKPVNGINGSGMHVHQSLWKGDENLFYDADGEFGLSDFARKYIAGLMIFGPPFALVLNPLINSYKRLVPGHEAPTRVTWGVQNRSAYVRVPENIRGNPKATRVELRSPDPAGNPYLGFASMLASGLQGWKSDVKVPNPISENVYTMADDDERLVYERHSETSCTFLRDLPANLGEAISRFRENDLAFDAFGEHIVEELIRIKRHEWARYNEWVTDFEIREYLPKV
jgi:glutamine synthetase